jgi:hypothetical protein
MAPLTLISFLLAGVAAPDDGAASKLDPLLMAKWQKAQVTPERRVDDATFVRRVWLDLAGRVPPALQARAFLDDAAPDKRRRLVDRLLAGDDFADHWGRAWAIQLTGMRPVKQEVHDGAVLHEYLRESLKADKSYRQIVTEILTGEGGRDASGPANFLLRYRAKPADLAGAVGKHFLGVTLQCAQCHHHPFAPWKQEDFWGVAAFFGRLRLFNAEEGDLTAVLEARRGELELPDPNGKPKEDGSPATKTVAPRMPAAKDGAAKVAGKRRAALAAWITADANPYFARNAVNQAWAQLFGTPLVKTLDDLDALPRAPHADLLEALTAEFRAGGYDLKKLVRAIVLSQAYQVSASGQADEDPDAVHARLQQFARFPMRPLSVDQLYYSIVQATGHKGDEDAQAAAADPEQGEETPDRPVEFLGEHGLTVNRALVLLNSTYVQEAVQHGGRLAVALNGRRVGREHVEGLFLATLARRPGADELKVMLDLVKAAKGPRGLEDVLWVILNSAEFNTNH